MRSFIMNSHEVFIHIHQGCFAGTGAIVRLPQCQWSKPDEYGKISQCITTTKHSKAKTVCIFLGIYCTSPWVAHGVIMLFALKVTNNICKPYTTRALLIMRIFISFDLHSVDNTLVHEQNIRYIKDISSGNLLYSYFCWSCHVSLNHASTGLVGSV